MQQRRPPQEFLDWLDANYRWDEAQSWKLSHAFGTDWQTDAVFQYWSTNVQPPDIAGPEFPLAGGQQDIERELGSLGSLDELDEVLRSWLEQGFITENEALGYARELGPLVDPETYFGLSAEDVNYLSAAGNDKELADRILEFGVEGSQASDLFRGFGVLRGAPRGAIRGARGRSLAEQVEQTQEKERQRFEGEAVRLRQQNEIDQTLSRLRQDPAMAEELAKLEPMLAAFRGTETPFDIREELGGEVERSPGAPVVGDPAVGEQIRGRLREIEQRSQREKVLRALSVVPGRDIDTREEAEARRFRKWVRQMPSGQGIVETLLVDVAAARKGRKERFRRPEGLEPGTRLAQFFQSELAQKESELDTSISDFLRRASTSQFGKTRKEWWENLFSRRDRPDPGQSAVFRRMIRRDPTLSPQQIREQLNPEILRNQGPVRGTDPIFGLMKEFNFNLLLEPGFRKRFFRQPGAGLARRLTPAARF